MNKGRMENVSKKTRILPSTLNEIQQDFQTWYPVNCNFGGKEHKTVHFPVFLKMHAMMFPKKYWPERIFVNWWVMQDTSQKKKIGKSKGGAGSVTQIINTYSADAIRLYYCHAASPYVDMEWSEIKIGQYQRDIEKIRNLIDVMTESFTNKHSTNISTDIETWLIYKLDEKFFEMFECLENYEIRKMTQECFYTIPKNIWRFIHRNGTFNEEIKIYIKTWIQYIAMITPFIAEKLYKKIGLSESVFSENSFIKKPVIIEKPSIVDEEEFNDDVIAVIIKI